MVINKQSFWAICSVINVVVFTMLPMLIKGILRARELSGKCGHATDQVAVKCGCACRFLPSQSTVTVPTA